MSAVNTRNTSVLSLTLAALLAGGGIGCSDDGGAANTAGSGGQAMAGTAGASAGMGGAVAGAGGNAAGAGGAAAGAGGNTAGGGGGGASGMAGGGDAGGMGGSGGAGGSAPYSPCPSNGDPCRIMPLGDSITDGAGSSDGASYRSKLFHLALMNNKKIFFVGSHENGPDMVDGVTFPKHQEGHSGWTIDDGGGRMGLYPRMQDWLTNTPPNIITLMIGTNDIDIALDPANAPKRLGLLLDRIIMYAPNALIVVAQIVPNTDADKTNIQTFNAAIPGLVKERTDQGKHLAVVDMYGAFTKNANYVKDYMNDRLHPKDAGYVVMADTWYAAIGSLLPAK